MKLIDGLKLQGRPAEIPDCYRDDLPQFFVNLGFKTGAEIGVDKGEFSEKFAKAGLSLHAIDPWKYDNDYVDSRTQERLEFHRELIEAHLGRSLNSSRVIESVLRS